MRDLREKKSYIGEKTIGRKERERKNSEESFFKQRTRMIYSLIFMKRVGLRIKNVKNMREHLFLKRIPDFYKNISVASLQIL